MHRHTTLLSLTFFVLLTPASCSRTAPILNFPENPVVVASSHAMTVQDVSTAIILAATRKGWEAKDDGHGYIVATLRPRQHVAVVQIKYSPRSYSIMYLSSQNLRHRKNEIHKNYNRWVEALKGEIDKQLSLVAAQPQ